MIHIMTLMKGQLFKRALLLQILEGRNKGCISRFKYYFSDPWNIFDQVMLIMLLVAVILRLTLANDNDFLAARYVYSINLVMFYLRILQLYYFHKRLGPKVILIARMVCVIN